MSYPVTSHKKANKGSITLYLENVISQIINMFKLNEVNVRLTVIIINLRFDNEKT